MQRKTQTSISLFVLILNFDVLQLFSLSECGYEYSQANSYDYGYSNKDPKAVANPPAHPNAQRGGYTTD